MISSASPLRIDGADTSPTKCTVRPRCMKRIAAICAARPERPWPEKNQRWPGSSNACTRRAKASASIAAEKLVYLLSHGQPRPGLGNLSRIHPAISFGLAASVMALPTTTISGSTAITASQSVGADAAGQRYQKTAGVHLPDRLDMRRRGVASQPRIGRRMDGDIAEAFGEHGIGRQQFRLAGFGDGVDDDRCAEGGGAPADHLMRGGRSAGQDGHEGGAGAEHHVGLELAAVDGLGVGQHHDIGAEFARGGDGRDAEAFQHRRADLDDVGERLHLRQQGQMFRLVEGDLQEQGGSFGVGRSWLQGRRAGVKPVSLVRGGAAHARPVDHLEGGTPCGGWRERPISRSRRPFERKNAGYAHCIPLAGRARHHDGPQSC